MSESKVPATPAVMAQRGKMKTVDAPTDDRKSGSDAASDSAAAEAEKNSGATEAEKNSAAAEDENYIVYRVPGEGEVRMPVSEWDEFERVNKL